MNQLARQKLIVELVRKHGDASIAEMARQLDVSEMTIRRDLDLLARTHRIVRTHGGAVPAERVTFEFNFLNRAREHQAEKDAIARRAAELLPDARSIMLDSGTTTLALARVLKDRGDLTVITTSLPIASELQFGAGPRVLLLGGYLRPDAPDLEGALTESNLEGLRADCALLGADGVDAEGFVYNQSLAVARMLEKMVQAARRVYILADHSKLDRPALKRFGQLKAMAGLITDSGAPAAFRQRLQRQGIAVLVADGESKPAGSR